MNLLHIIASLDRASGGTVEAIRTLSSGLRERGVAQTILSLDGPGEGLAEGFEVPIRQFGRAPIAGDGLITRLRNWRDVPPEALAWGREHLREFDAAIVHGLWNRSTRLAGLLLTGSGTPYCLYPHGMLDPWFRRHYPLKHWGKQALWLVNEGRLLNGAAAVLFTCEGERLAARGSFRPYHARERVVAFGTEAPPRGEPGQEAAFRALLPALGNRPYLLFLSRIHEKKGCDLLLEAFAAIAARHPEIDLVMAGPDVAGLAPQLRAQADAAGIGGRVHWPGMVTGAAKYGAYRGAAAFVLPSHQENFGIVVAEALACGCPVLISDKVNIWHEIAAAGAGLVAPDTAAGTLQLLEDFLALSGPEVAAMKRAGQALFERSFTSAAAADDLLRVLREISSR